MTETADIAKAACASIVRNGVEIPLEPFEIERCWLAYEESRVLAEAQHHPALSPEAAVSSALRSASPSASERLLRRLDGAVASISDALTPDSALRSLPDRAEPLSERMARAQAASEHASSLRDAREQTRSGYCR